MRFFKYSEPETVGEETLQEKQNTNNKRRTGSFLAKIVCVLAAMVVWFYVSAEQSQTYEKEFYNLDVEYSDIASLEKQGYTLISGDNATVDVIVTGKRNEVNSINKSDIIVSANLSEIYTPDKYTLPLKVEVPGNSSARVMPGTIEVYVDKAAQNEIPVEPIIKSGGTTDLNIEIELVPELKNVRITGPEEEIAKISHAAIDIKLDGFLNSSTKYKGQIYLVDNSGEKYSNAYVKCSKTELEVFINVNKYKTVPVEASFGDSDADTLGYDVSLSYGSVKIRGNADIVDEIATIYTENIDTARISGSTTLVAELVVPPGVELVDSNENVIVTIVPHTANNIEVSTSNIVLINLDDEFSAKIGEESKTFLFSASLVSAPKLTGETIYAIADMSAFSKEGTYDVKLKVVYPDFDDVNLKGDYYCKVILTKK